MVSEKKNLLLTTYRLPLESDFFESLLKGSLEEFADSRLNVTAFTVISAKENRSPGKFKKDQKRQ